MINILSAIQEKYQYRDKKPYYYFVQIGTGGTGGYIIQHLAQMFGTSSADIDFSYVIADFDHIEEKNLRNQLFLEEEIGLKKADVLANRYSDAYNLDIGSFSDSYIESVENLMNLFSMEYLNISSYDTKLIPVLIGSVDNNYTRQIMDSLFHKLNDIIYIDAGNESTNVPADWQTRNKSQWTEEEIQSFNNSGWSGQVVTGVKLNGVICSSPVAAVFPDILTDTDSIKPSDMSCSELSASEPQRLIVNKYSALAVANYVNEIIETQCISNHITFFHSRKGYMRSVPVEELETTE
ncbi:thiamine biosynthesis protein ThiF [Rummeliibacillus stabekisii]|uniref:ThiF family adenylyltransferase n=1 Tax=Rummeliibacillus stabekisii TaxID=241244 RepID=UPI002040FF4B|nr:ThiF family adenylyltransferase [Rummeliibacillus stabekisii]MCM3317951.1 thiamine biosynthesis protein ThiF [Rummeliibacillus stabekisii]